MKLIFSCVMAMAVALFSFSVLAEDVAAPVPADVLANAVPLTLCTGLKTGNYKKAGDLLAANAINVTGDSTPVAITVELSDGSPDNLKRLNLAPQNSQHCDAAFVQNDVLVTYKKMYPDLIAGLSRGGNLYNEWVHLICNKNSGVNSIADLDATKTIAVGKPTQGHNVTWQGFRNAAAQGWFSSERKYDKVKMDEREMGYAILTDVNEGNGPDCLMYVGAFGTKFIAVDAASSDFTNLKLVPAVDPGMKDVMDDKGKPVYSFSVIPGDQYANLLDPGFIFSGDVETVGVTAVFVVASSWANKHPDAYEAVLRAFTKSKTGIAALVKPVE